ncbi:hypothetical protein WJX75_004300 [Coccomyxa subellipsoidea]|uniref:Multiple myeloma tumor-associated protein 2-like N-terminal domain-containing protein n=1 Tax=Coccomyxa subellipsoidea TaxID=248742 RepID=A0ABR2Z0D8_9CHLO
MSLYNGPPRGGTRGGADQFSWDNVKADKDREYYLGHSVKALTGRWQKGKDVYWYTREKGDAGDSAAAAELLAVKQREEELMAEALGIKPKVVRAPKQPQLDQREMAQLMSKDAEEGGDEEARDREAERIKGLGYSVNAVRGAGEAEHEVLAGTVPSKPLPGPPPTHPGQLPLPPTLTEAEAKRMRKAQKKAAKEARRAEKKEKRKAKKALKKAKKSAKRAKVEAEAGPPADVGGSSPSSSSDSGDSDDAKPAATAQDLAPTGRREAPSAEPVNVKQEERSPRDGGHRREERREEAPRRQRHDSSSPERQDKKRMHDSPSRERQDRKRRHDSLSPERQNRSRRHDAHSPEPYNGHRRDREDDRDRSRRANGDERGRERRRGGSPERGNRREVQRSRSRDRRRRDRS